MHQSLQVATFHIEHIVPQSAGGPSLPGNLALACPSCNLHKANRLAADDPQTSVVVPFFHPRLHPWTDHFAWAGYEVVGRTPIGRATVEAFDLNQQRRVNVRRAEEAFGLFPPTASEE
jgi:HNH endonuclease